MPRCRLSATFSAAWRQTLQVRNRLSPSFHSPLALSRNRGVEATRNLATAWPVGVYRSSGSSTRLPARVIWVSPAAIEYSWSFRWCFGSRAYGSVAFRAQDLGPQDRLVQAELAVEFPDGVRLGHHVNDGVNALGLLVDVVGQPPPAPYVDLVHASAPVPDNREELIQRGLDGVFLKTWIEDDHHFVAAHGQILPPLDWRGHGLSVTGGTAPGGPGRMPGWRSR